MTDEEAKKMASDHWKYTEKVLECSGYDGNMGIIQYLYEAAMVHGVKHEREN